MIDERNTQRDERILAAASHLAVTHGLNGFTRGLIALHSGLSRAGVSNYGRSRITNGPQGTAGVLDRIRDDVMRQAVDKADLSLLATEIAARHPIALSAPDDLRVAAVAGS
jgi:AcrR family transcriptional regulator